MNAIKNFIGMVMPLAVLGAVLTAFSHVFAGRLSVGIITEHQIYSATSFIVFFLIILTLFFGIDSVRLAKHFTDEGSKQVDIAALWRGLPLGRAMVTGSALVALVVFSINGNANLIEIYRTHTSVWQDHVLWNIEAPLFHAMAPSNFLPLAFWEIVYHLMWIYVLIVMAALVKNGRTESYMVFATAIVLAFYFRSCIAMFFPVAGPEYYQPELFNYLQGSSTRVLQDFLGKYQAGKVAQNGLFYGTVAMPSLHVALTAMATWFVACHWRRMLWCAIPWFVLIWFSTVVLAWHYVLDGVVALGITFICIVVSRTIFKVSQRLGGGLVRAE